MILTLHGAGPGLTVQDLGRPGHAGAGLSRGGAADRLAVLEACALLGAPHPLAAIEVAGSGVEVSCDAPARIALTGAPMRALLDGTPVGWNRTLRLAPGRRLALSPGRAGLYGYLTPGGGVATPTVLGSRSANLGAGIGAALASGDAVPCGADPDAEAGDTVLAVEDRFTGGTVRIMDGPQTAFFSSATRARFMAARFTRSAQGNRQGVRLSQNEGPFATRRQLDLVSDIIVPGDVQMTGDGVPYVLLADCQTTGGYPRIGTVVPCDLPRVAQAQPGCELRFRRLALAEVDALASEDQTLAALRRAVRPRLRDPRDMPDLLAYQLIGGVTAGDEGG